ncbi:MAG: polyphosphate kinase 1 [Flavobacteriaceae bacterium]|nr:polyphosphate kinase 1 [Flavobacteriaceae bacterium]
MKYINRELSWLDFNTRVLQESADSTTPLIERLRFLGIFSNNLDEFFKVRYATVRRIVLSGKKGKKILGGYLAKDLLEDITKKGIQLQADSAAILHQVQKELEKEHIFIVNETQVLPEHEQFVKDYFIRVVSPGLMTIILDEAADLPQLKDKAAYLAVKMEDNSIFVDAQQTDTEKKEALYALIEISKEMERFVVLPTIKGKQYIMLVDDLIRCCMHDIFSMFNYEKISAHMIKITRDAELDIDHDLTKSFIEKISNSVKGREISHPVRFVYDKEIDTDTLAFLIDKMDIVDTDSTIPGGRYHNRSDYMDFPSLGRTDLLYDRIEPLLIDGLPLEGSILERIAAKDYLQYTPYHSFAYVVKFLREAALDPYVETIKITIYRLAKNSQIVASLINAARNGKQVTVQIELQARFDEKANIGYAADLQQEGIRVIFGVPGLKVHSKICVIERREAGKNKRYGFVSTGNFNESTAKLYTDYTLFTAHAPILKEIHKVFDFFETNYKVNKYKHLIVSPHYTRNRLLRLIDGEIENARMGKEAYIKLKMNSLTDYGMIDKLYEASSAGVKIQMIVRGICCLIPGLEGLSENIEAISIIDKFLEHPRMYVFYNDNVPKVYISSADMMTRNIDNRVEVAVPIYDKNIISELLTTFEICWQDNVKARVFNKAQDNAYKRNDLPKVRSQFATYAYYLKKKEEIDED